MDREPRAWLDIRLTRFTSEAACVGSTAAGYAYRVHVEEAALVRTLGDSYRAYMDRTWRFVPYVV